MSGDTGYDTRTDGRNMIYIRDVGHCGCQFRYNLMYIAVNVDIS